MNLQHLSKREKFYFDVGEALSMNNMRCFINQETLEVEISSGDCDNMLTGEEDTAYEALNNPDKYLHVEFVSPSEAFRAMTDFAETVKDKQMQQRLTDALNGRKPFANFNHLVHTTKVREQWFDFKNHDYSKMAKEWIEDVSPELKEKIKALYNLKFC